MLYTLNDSYRSKCASHNSRCNCILRDYWFIDLLRSLAALDDHQFRNVWYDYFPRFAVLFRRSSDLTGGNSYNVNDGGLVVH